jgi:hypothetical protein
MLSDDLDNLEELVEYLETHDLVNGVLLDDMKPSGVGHGATARLEIGFGGRDEDHAIADPRSRASASGRLGSLGVPERDVDSTVRPKGGLQGDADEAEDSNDSHDSCESEGSGEPEQSEDDGGDDDV